MADIKSALEIAAEKAEKLGAVTEEERLKWKYTPEGEKLAVRCLKEACNLVVELSHYEEKARKYVIDGAADILVRNISLPKNGLTRVTRSATASFILIPTTETDLCVRETILSLP